MAETTNHDVQEVLGNRLPPDRRNSSPFIRTTIDYHADLQWFTQSIPFREKADYGLGCDQCYMINNSSGKHRYIAHTTTYCKCNIIAIKNKGSLLWDLSIRLYPGITMAKSYTLCKFVVNNMTCLRNRCTHPHNPIEQSWWNLEKANKLNIKAFREYLQFERLIKMFGGRFVFICKECYLSSRKVTIVNQEGICPKHQTLMCNRLLVHAGSTGFTPIFPRPTKNFRLCKNMDRCIYSRNACFFGHSEKEIAIWSLEGNLNDYQILVNWSQCTNPQNLAIYVDMFKENNIENILTPQSVKCRGDYCEDCSLQFKTKQDLLTHNNSVTHLDNIKFDQLRQWNFRQPKWTLSIFTMCDKHMNGQLCSFSNMSASLNYCPEAHSQLEIQEWETRKRWREMNKQLSDEVDKCIKMQNLITSGSLKMKLQNLVLLDHDDRLEFSFLKSQDNSKHQLLTSDSVLEEINNGLLKFNIDIYFTTNKPGFYAQTMILEFDDNIIISQKISVLVDTSIVKPIGEVILEDVSIDQAANHDASLSKRYPPPSKADFMKAKYDECFVINRYNYKHKMHKLISSEEYTRQLILSQYNMETEINITNELQGETFLCAQNGELFGSIVLQEDLCEDTDKGRLLLESVQSTIIQPTTIQSTIIQSTIIQSTIYRLSDNVYEVPLVRMEKFSGRHKNHIFIKFSSEMVTYLDLKPNTTLQVNIRFKMDRGLFYRMHHAVDILQNMDVVFPPVNKLNVINWNEEDIKISGGRLSEDQLKTVRHIVAKKKNYSPPLIVYGPFGTGKTETLAESTKILLTEKKCRILICTFTNSAADIYFTKYLDEFLQSKRLINSTLRIYHKDRRLKTVPESCRPYILYSEEDNSFYLPSKEDILSKKLIVTTVETAIELTTLNVNELFTHIFIDEAAQALECQLLIPLSLANDKTCIVLTGDHRQMNPTLYSKDAQKQGFGHSLLERLHNYYNGFFIDDDSMVNLFLNRNYRSEKKLLEFISDTFYGGSNVLICKSGDWGTNVLESMNFYCVNGQEIQEENSTSFYNESEADLIAEGVEFMSKNWPRTWGEICLESIQVVAPYAQQVNLIRSKLRDRRLGRVSVERIYNIQGKQFRALFISTVRTKNILKSAAITNCLKNDDTEIGEYGFLTDTNMLNTAFTRAQSYVAVVGDVIALCSIGQCREIWKKFIYHCHELGTLYPNIFEDIQQEVNGIENSELGKLLQKRFDQKNKIQRLIIPQIKCHKTLRNVWKFGKLSDKIKSKLSRGFLQLHAENNGTASPEARQRKVPKKVETPFKYGTQVEKHQDAIDDTDDWNDFKMKPDEIIQKLVENSTTADELMSDTTSAQNENKPFKISYKVKEERGHAVVYPVKSVIHDKGRQVISKDDVQDEESLETSDEEGEKYKGVTDAPIRRSRNKTLLLQLLADEPNKYKKCMIEIYNEIRKARLISPEENIREINLREDRQGRALEYDLVVVEILSDITDSTQEIRGRVVGILERSLELRYKVFICRTNSINTSVMIPINKNMLPIINLTLQDRDKKHKDGKVVMYNFTKSGHINFKGYETIDPSNPNSKLFKVRVLKFSKTSNLPLGIVFGTHPIGDNLTSGTSIIDNQYHVKTTFTQQVLELCKPSKKCKINTPLFPQRKDLTQMMCFTIDPPNSMDLDDALSLTVENNLYVVGIHIADVGHFVTKDSALDLAAFKSCCTYYRIDEKPINMLPESLSTSTCSLLPNVNRLTVSILLYLDEQWNVVRAEPHKAIINSKQRLTYEEAQNIIKSKGQQDYVSCSIKQLNDIADAWRAKRVGVAWVYKNIDFIEKHHAQAHTLVAELMIMANHHVALILQKAFPDCSPIRVHMKPKEKSAEEWKGEHFEAAFNSVCLVPPCCSENCSQNGPCKCLDEYATSENFENTPNFHIPLDTIEILSEAAEAGGGGDWLLFKYLFLSLENYPQMTVALAQMRKMQERSYYICSRLASSPLNAHYGLKLPSYTHFTSPIRRYFDIIVHRMLDAYIMNCESPYSEEELDKIAWKCNTAFRNSKNYERSIFKLHCSLAFEKLPLIYYPPIENITESEISIIFPTIPDLRESGSIKMRLLAPSCIPEVKEDKSVLVSWRERIYNMQSSEVIDGSSVTQLVSPKKNLLVSSEKWQSILKAVCNNEIAKAILEFKDVTSTVEDNSNYKWVHDLSGEASISQKLSHFVRFSSEYKPGSLLKIQMAAGLERGISTPKIQLLCLTSQLSLCLEHRQDPISCFTELASRRASKPTYKSIDEYKGLWLPVLAMEAATAAVKGQEQVFIHNVEIEWKTVPQNGIEGNFILHSKFCDERGLNLLSLLSDYVCVRYKDLRVDHSSDISDKINGYVNHKEKVTFVCHCIVISVLPSSKGVDGKITENAVVTLKLHQCAMSFPQHLLEYTCRHTLEVIPKSLPQRLVSSLIYYYNY
ncbi:hypothetical protein LOTGIDRAFT_154099 [Lottia gigantea]|uniref:C2H2-type domain-containing protein n=1 Tax=Lottia gigantea TaxID=225164 RepID=V4BKB7_LOTGI|nr:hypothetical protein LOTGIDRAFT_154099 [Lottia gigantea]ESO89024.1 hypothetical protein LOTGIDRAFT_154099 [Lottia gigantea]